MSSSGSEYLLSEESECDKYFDSDVEFEGALSDASSYDDTIEYPEPSSDVDIEDLGRSTTIDDDLSFSKSGYEWSSNSKVRTRTRLHNFITDKPGPSGDAEKVESILSTFMLFFSDIILEKILYYTNKFCLNNIRYMYTNTITMEELKAFFGILIASGRCNGSKISFKQIWDTHPLFKQYFFQLLCQEIDLT